MLFMLIFPGPGKRPRTTTHKFGEPNRAAATDRQQRSSGWRAWQR